MEGWAFKAASGRYHYFRDGLSLCKNWIACKNPPHEQKEFLIQPQPKCLTCERILENENRRPKKFKAA